MVISVEIYPYIYQTFSAEVRGYDENAVGGWLTIKSGENKIIIYGGSKNMDALKVIADLFNDAFAPPEPAPAVSRDLDDDLPF